MTLHPFTSIGPAAALEHVHAAQDFSAKHDASGTVREARIAESLDPNNPEAHAILGDTFAAAGDTTAARAEYSAALHSSELDPVFQKGLLAQLQAKTKR